MLAFTYRNKSRALPESWDEVGPAAWYLLRLLARHPSGKGRAEALRELVGLSRREWERLPPDLLEDLSAGLEWLGPTSIRKPLRASFRVGWRRYYLPSEDFLDGQAMAYALADDYFAEVVSPESTEAATTAALRLLATIARPRKGLSRAPLGSVEEVEARAERFRKLPPEHLVHALMYWAGVREVISEAYGTMLFEPSPLDRPSEVDMPHYGWWSIFQDVAEGGVFGNLPAVERANFHEVCQWLVRKEAIRRANQLEAEKHKNKP